VDYQTLFVFAADLCNHRIQIFTEDGTFIGKFGKNGNGPGEFNNPTGNFSPFVMTQTKYNQYNFPNSLSLSYFI
jgi:hypothetical protein